MLTVEQVDNLNVGANQNDPQELLMIEAALEWVEDKTSYKVDYDNLTETPANIRLFVIKYMELMSGMAGVQSESIEGLSQSKSGQVGEVLKEYAEQLLGAWLNSSVGFIPAVSRW